MADHTIDLDITRLREAVVVRPGDTLVVRVDTDLTLEQAQEWRALLEERLPGVRCVIVGADQLLVYQSGGDGDG